MPFLRSHHEPLFRRVVGGLCQLEADAATACREASARVVDEPLTRGMLLSFLSEHEAHYRALRPHAGKHGRGAPSQLETRLETRASRFRNARGTTEVLRILRANAEVAVRRYRSAMPVVPDDLLPTVRAQCNAWLRHRAWLSARVDAFSRMRASSPSFA